MPSRPDDAKRISGSRLCEITGVNRQTRDKWASDGLLRKADDYDQLDLIEVVVLKLLLETLRKKHARIAWARIRPKLREVMATPRLTLVWDAERRLAELAFDPESIVALVKHGRSVQVLDLGGSVEDARAAFRREVEAVAAVDDRVRERTALHKSRDRSR
jgi:hypothetical protein